MRPITEKEQSSLAQRQARLLASGFEALKPGGQLVYSTCTLAPEENEGVLESLLRLYPDAVEIEELTDRLPSPAPALSADGVRVFDPRVQRAARLWPHRFGTAGFFAALLTKTASVDSPQEAAPYRPIEQAGQRPVGRNHIREITARLMDQYGFDLFALMEAQNLDIWQSGDTLYAVPQLFLGHFRGLPVQRLGLPLGEEIREDLVLSHEWTARFGLNFSRGSLLLPDEMVTNWLRGEDLHQPPAHEYPKGFIVIVTDRQGRNLGRGKILQERVKNMLPSRAV